MKEKKKNFEAKMERKITFAKERDTRVVFARTNDTHTVLNIIKDADRGIRLARANLLIRYSIEEVLPLLAEYQEAVQKLHEAALKICALTGVPYRPPKGLGLTAAGGDGKVAQKEKLIDARMKMAYEDIP